MRMHAPVLLLILLTVCCAAEEADQDGLLQELGMNLADPLAGLTPAQVADAEERYNGLVNDFEFLFPDGQRNVRGELDKKAMGKSMQASEHAIDETTRMLGYNPLDMGARSAVGPLSFSWGWKPNAGPSWSPQERMGVRDPLSIIESNGNLLSDVDKQAKEIANKIEKSKFICGDLDWVVQLKAKFNKAALEKYVDALSESALAASGMAFLANWSPTLYEIVKFLRAVASADLDAERIQCGDLENAFIDIGDRIRRGHTVKECMDRNSGVDYQERVRMCNGTTSPFDGVEGWAGKITGFVGQLKTVNVTKQLGNMMRGPEPQPDAALVEKTQEKQAEVTRIQQLAAAHAATEPGQADPNWNKWNQRMNEINQSLGDAQEELDGALRAQNASEAGMGNLWANLRNGLADNLPNILGNITLGANADLQFGKTDQFKLIIEFDYFAFKHAESFKEALLQHAQILHDTSRESSALIDSYTELFKYTYHSFLHPWQKDENERIRSIKFTMRTLDRLALLWWAFEEAPAESPERTDWRDKYRFIEATNRITRNEIYTFVERTVAEQKYDAISEAQERFGKIGPAGDRIVEIIEKNLEKYHELLKEQINAAEMRLLAESIDAVNSFDPFRRLMPSTAPPTMPPPPIQMPFTWKTR